MKNLFLLPLAALALLLASCGSSSNVVDDLAMPVTIDYSKTIEQLVADGHYDYINSDISSSAFVKNEVVKTDTAITCEAILINFNRSMSSEDVIAQMRMRGFRPGTAKELYALGARYPRLQREISIIALGSVTAGSGVPGLWGRVSGDRYAFLWYWSRDWGSGGWFLAFRDI